MTLTIDPPTEAETISETPVSPPADVGGIVDAPPEAGEMKGISLWQPWASLIAWGEKKIETRSWPTKYRGPIAIFATAGIKQEAREAVENSPEIKSALNRNNCSLVGLPMGCIVAVADLVDCFQFTEGGQIEAKERSFGDYTPGRFGFILENVRALPTPIKCAGGQRIFNVSAEIAAEIKAQFDAPSGNLTPAALAEQTAKFDCAEKVRAKDTKEKGDGLIELPACMLRAVGLAAKDDGRYSMTGVLVEVIAEKSLVSVIATDGRRMLIAQCNRGLFDEDVTVYVPGAIARNASRIASVRPTRDEQAVVTIEKRPKKKWTLTAYTIDGPVEFEWTINSDAPPFPPYKEIIPDWSESTGIGMIGITPELVASAMHVIQRIVGKEPKMKVYLPSRSDRPFGLESQDGETIKALAIIMPANIDGWTEQQVTGEKPAPGTELPGTTPPTPAPVTDDSWRAVALDTLTPKIGSRALKALAPQPPASPNAPNELVFAWEETETEWRLISPAARVAAAVFKEANAGKKPFIWIVWDEDGTGGENSVGTTIKESMEQAEAAMLRWGKHGIKEADVVKISAALSTPTSPPIPASEIGLDVNDLEDARVANLLDITGATIRTVRTVKVSRSTDHTDRDAHWIVIPGRPGAAENYRLIPLHFSASDAPQIEGQPYTGLAVKIEGHGKTYFVGSEQEMLYVTTAKAGKAKKGKKATR